MKTQPSSQTNRPAMARTEGQAAVTDRMILSDGQAIAVIAILMVLISVPYYFGRRPLDADPLSLVHQQMYYIPIAYAAFRFGRRGGVVSAVVACALIALSLLTQLSGGSSFGFEPWLEIGSLLAVGAIFGAMRDMERARTADLRHVSQQLESANRKLEERAIQYANIQGYTQSILRSITSGVLTVGPDGSVVTANIAAERMIGLSEFEMVPKPIGSLFRVDGGLGGDVTKVLAGRLPLALRETTLQTADGRELRVQATTSLMRAVGGDSLGAVVALEDVSEIRALTDQLIRADRLAAMGQLTAGVAHEIRNPLGIIRATVQLMEDTRADPARIKSAAEVIKQETDRLDRVIKALLDFGRPSKPTLLPIDLHEVISDVILFTTRFAIQSGVRIVQHIEDDLSFVNGDPDQLKQVFLNLMTNAVHSMARTGGTITIEARSDEYFVEVSVADTGPGIASDDLPRVFDPFFTRRAEGTGLGLTIVHRIVDDHKGHIEVESGPSGTVFRVQLPVALETKGTHE